MPMIALLRLIRERYHPLFRLRRSKAFQRMARHIDFDVPTRIDGVDFPVYVSSVRNASLLLSRGRLVEEGEQRSFRRIVRDNRIEVFWDIGANVGLYAFAFLSLVPRGRAVLFEPDRDNLRLLEKTIARSRPAGAVLVGKAVSDRSGALVFYPDPITGASGSLTTGEDGALFVSRHHGFEARAIEVEGTTLDCFARDQAPPDLIKIDIEGAELAALRGGLATLRRCKPAIFFEASKESEAISSLLLELGYVFYDMATLKRSARLVHNNLALHPENHVLY